MYEKNKLNFKLKKISNPDFVNENEEDEEVNEDDSDFVKIEKYEKKYLKILKAEEENNLYGDFEFDDESAVDEEIVF